MSSFFFCISSHLAKFSHFLQRYCGNGIFRKLILVGSLHSLRCQLGRPARCSACGSSVQQADAARMSGWVWLQRRLALRSSGGAEFERFSTAGFGPASQVQPRCSAGFCSDIFFDMTFSAVLTVRGEERSLRLEKLRAGRLTRGVHYQTVAWSSKV